MKTVLAGADLVLPDRVLRQGSLVLEGERIVAIEPRVIDGPASATHVDLAGCLIVPGFIDVHVHGVAGHDVLDGPEAVREVASRLPCYGVTAFCPTSVACGPAALRQMLGAVRTARALPLERSARVLPAHLESNFINPEYKGAQPEECLRLIRPQAPGPRPQAGAGDQAPGSRDQGSGSLRGAPGEFTGRDILDVIAAHREAVGIVTLAPELDGGLELVRNLAAAGHIVSIGHTAASYEQTLAAIDAGARHATHLFNRMPAMSHRAPGAPGALLQSDRICAELICDGFHVHPALMQVAIRAKGSEGIMAITDGTAGSGLPVGSRARLGGRPITVTERTAELDDGTLAGSVLTMDGAFRALVQLAGLSVIQAARLCATCPARQLGLTRAGRLEAGAMADLVVLDQDLRVRQTWLAGTLWRNQVKSANV